MRTVYFNTSNETKIRNAQKVCEKYGLEINRLNHDIDEIQSEDPKRVALDKAARACAIVKKPIVVTDDSWQFLGLNGFPGVYMHSMNTWFSPDDFLRLTRDLSNRKVVLIQYLIYTDLSTTKVFKQETSGELIKETRGTSPHPSHTVIAMSGDKGLTIAEAYNKGIDRSKRESARIWHDFAKWYTAR